MSVQIILMKWALESKDYYMAYILYTEYNTGIPNSLLYGLLPSKKMFSSISDFEESCDTKYSQDKYLNKIFVLFKLSKYKRLSEWDNKYGYILNC
jgi:hypothetical protein